jgi:immune inhibitor A
VIVPLPNKQVTTQVGSPFAGSKFYYSGTADQMDTAMTKAFTLPAGATLSAKARYNIEQDFDYAYLEASTDGGTTWTYVATNLSTTTDPNGQNLGQGITGVSASGDWVDLTADLSAFSGPVQLRFEYVTDPAQQGQPGAEQYTPGFSLDEIAITGQAADGAETNTGWTFASTSSSVGFHITTGSETNSYFNAYIAEYRQYRGYDDSLRTGPYNFGFLDTPNKQNYVEHFRYADGLLVWYWDTSEADNNTSVHPGSGLILPVDSHPTPLIRPDGQPWRPRVQSYDATFDLEKTDPLTLHLNSVKRNYPSQPGVAVFDDNNTYWNAQIPTSSVQAPHTGTKIRIQGFTNLGLNMRIRVGPSA